MTRPFAFAAAIVAVAFVVGCEAGPGVDKTPESPQTEAPVPAVAPVTSAQPLVAAGPAAPLTAERDENLQWAASVVDLFPIEDQGAKLFGTAGGDPAMNGLYTHVAFFAGPADGWAVYRIGDFLDFKVLSVAKGRVDLEVQESGMDPTTQVIGSRSRRIIVGWTPGPDDGPPTTVTVTPAT